MSEIHVSSHHAMTTWWQVQIADQDADYAQQAAQAAFQITDQLEVLLSRFRPDSEISMIAQLRQGESMRLSEPVFACLRQAKAMEALTGGAFNVGAGSWPLPQWELDEQTFQLVAETGECQLDLGAIGKGFALDRMAEELADWGIESFFLLSSASSILAGQSPPGKNGWPVRIGNIEFALQRAAVGASGTSMRGKHILNPVSGQPAIGYQRTWAMAGSAAQADALSTAFMNMEWACIEAVCAQGLGAMVEDAPERFRSAGTLKTQPASEPPLT